MDFRRAVALANSSVLLVRTASLFDIARLHGLYSGLSDETKHFFFPSFFQPRLRSLWIRDAILFALSGMSGVRKLLLKIFPRACYLTLIASNSSKQIVAFFFCKIRRKMSKECLEAEFGIVVRGDYQNKGLGSKLHFCGNEFAKNNGICRLVGLVDKRNLKAIEFDQKLGYRIIKQVCKKNQLTGEYYQAYLVILLLKESDDVVLSK
jgi:GNAT superfamily N-acetyltransferase